MCAFSQANYMQPGELILHMTPAYYYYPNLTVLLFGILLKVSFLYHSLWIFFHIKAVIT